MAWLLLLAGLASASWADGPEADQDTSAALKQLSLAELGNVEVTTASKEPEEVWKTPPAVYVITQEDIRRSGATSFPEILRLAPGVEVAQIDSDHWSVSIRGFGAELANKLLVLIDGRSVYAPLYAASIGRRRLLRCRTYSVRVSPTRNHDELSTLIDTFNEMLGQIQERDTALREVQDSLEQRVQERTAQLNAANADLEASYAGKAALWQEHLLYTQSFFYFISQEPKVPSSLRAEVNQWGLPKDEFADTAHWPNQLYIREGRRLDGSSSGP